MDDTQGNVYLSPNKAQCPIFDDLGWLTCAAHHVPQPV